VILKQITPMADIGQQIKVRKQIFERESALAFFNLPVFVFFFCFFRKLILFCPLPCRFQLVSCNKKAGAISGKFKKRRMRLWQTLPMEKWRARSLSYAL
jgi:hypothetical protein